MPLEHWQHSHQRLVQACAASPRLTDCASIQGAVRINMRPEAVAKRLGEKALSLLDAPLPTSLPPGEAAAPATPQRFSIPLQTIDSNTSLASMAGGAGGEAPLSLLGPSPLGPSPLGSAAALRAHRSEASLASSTGTAEHAAPAAVPTPFAAPQRVPLML